MKAALEDFRCSGDSTYARVRECLANPAMWAVFGYRFRRWAATVPPRPVRWVLALITLPLQVGIEALTHVQLSAGAHIGGGLYVPHVGTIVVGSGSRLGEHCTLGHNVTVGHAGGGRSGRIAGPRLGDRVYVGPGATVLGPVVVGDDALIGAAAVVVKDVPCRGVVVGNPARLLHTGGSSGLIRSTDTLRPDSGRASAVPSGRPRDSIA